MNKQRLASTALAALAMAAFSPVASAATTWNFGSGCSGTNNGSYGNTWTCGSGSSQVTANAWSTATNGGNEGAYRTAELERYGGSGFGVRNRESSNGDGQSPEHAIDNQNGTDLIALSFAQSVSLSSLSIGWWESDSDISVLAYTGAGAPPSLSNYNASTLLGAGSGWTLVGNYGGAGSTSSKSINSANISSSWWLVSAYNSNFGSGSGGLGQGNDYVKLLAVAGTRYTPPPPPPGVPEPGTLALAGIALAGAWQVRRRKTSAAS